MEKSQETQKVVFSTKGESQKTVVLITEKEKTLSFTDLLKYNNDGFLKVPLTEKEVFEIEKKLKDKVTFSDEVFFEGKKARELYEKIVNFFICLQGNSKKDSLHLRLFIKENEVKVTSSNSDIDSQAKAYIRLLD